MALPEGLKFAKTHEWVKLDGTEATVGISQHAADELGDVALVLLPEVGRALEAGEPFGEIESLKAVSDLYAPVAGTITAVNSELMGAPERVNGDPYGTGWLIRLDVSDASALDSLMDSAAYDQFMAEA